MNGPRISRRKALFALGASAFALQRGRAADAPRSPFGICIYSFGSTRKFEDPVDFLDVCHSLGAAGIQMPLKADDPVVADLIKEQSGDYGMYYEGIVTLPKADVDEFEQQLIVAKAAGATVVRSACLSGRRYETFSTAAEWQQFVKDSHAAIDRAIPVLEKQKIALALENHKDWTAAEMLDLLHRHQSEYLGVCLDFGNNVSLLDDQESVLKLAPYAMTTHAKDIAVEPAPDGFRMSEVPLSQGTIDVAAFVSATRKARPQIRFNLEMITRDPLSIPCLTDKYWATFPKRDQARIDRTMAMVNQRKSPKPLPKISHLAASEQSTIAERNLATCLEYARVHFAA